MPYKSQAQRGKFHAMLARGEISAATVEEWDRASEGRKLPKRVKKGRKMTPSQLAAYRAMLRKRRRK